MKKGAKVAIIGLSVVAIGTGAFLLYRHYTKKSELNPTDDLKEIEDIIKPSKSISPRSNTPMPIRSDFPVKKGSKGKIVQGIQNLLIKKYGAAILPKYGADGFYGQEMYDALLSKKLPTTIDASSFTKIVETLSKPSGIDPPKPVVGQTPSEIATNLYQAIKQNHISKAIINLKGIVGVDAYKKVNVQFKSKLINGVHKTIVTGLLDRFKLERDRALLKNQFLRIGLKLVGNKWSIPSTNPFSFP